MHFGAAHNFWLLLLIPLLAAFIAWALVRRRRDLLRFARAELADKLSENASPLRQRLKGLLLLAGVLFLVLALTGPQFGAKLEMARRKGVDVMVLLDVSRSMLAEDVKPSRLERAKFQIGALLDALEGDRVGLVVFAGQAFVQCPLTLDYGALHLFLEVLGTDTVPVQGTAIGDALRLASACFDEGDNKHKVVVLFTDGEDHLGAPLEAAEKAAAQGVRIFAVGMGTPEGELIPVREQGGVAFHKDQQGNYIKSRLDEGMLRKIALATDGDYFRVSLGGGEIEAIHRQIAQMDQKEFSSTRFTQYEERYQIPLFCALACFLAEALLGDGRSRSGEWKGRFA